MADQPVLKPLSQEEFDKVLMGMEFHDEVGESFSVLDTQEGRVIWIPGDVWRAIEDGESTDDLPDWEREHVTDARAVASDDSGRFVRVPLWEAPDEYELMERFAWSVEDERLARALDQALGGSGSFGRFKRALYDFPEERQQWFRTRDDRIRQEAIEWLETLGFALPEE